MSEPAVVVHDYHAAYNAITEPDKFVACSRYFVRRWMPALGDNGTRIVLALRSMGFYNRETGERRDGIEIEMTELAALVGIHVATLKREFGDKKGEPGMLQNPALHLFVRKEQQYWRDPVTNRLLRTANIYRVMMDDPIHDEDLPRMNELLAEREKGASASKAQNAPQMPKSKQPLPSKAQNAPKEVQSAPKNEQSESKQTHFAPSAMQNAPTLIDYSAPLSHTSSPSEDAPGAHSEFSLALFQEQEAVRTWSQLTEAEQQPYRIQAEQELTTLFGFAEWSKIGARAHDRQVCTRAETLYKAAVKEDRG